MHHLSTRALVDSGRVAWQEGKLLAILSRNNSKTAKTIVSGNKKSKSKITATPTKTADLTTARRQPVPNDENPQITEPAISLELRQTNLEEQVKKQNELIEKLTKKVNTLERDIIILEGKLAVSQTVSKLLEKESRWLRGILSKTVPHSVRCEKRKKWKYGEPDRNHPWQTGTDWNTQRRTENQYRQIAQNWTLSTQYQYTTCDR